MTEEEFQTSFDNTPLELADLPLWNEKDAHRLLCEICEKHQIDPRVITELVKWEREQRGNARKASRTTAFDAIFEERLYWERKQ